MISPAIAASIFKSLGFDPEAFKKILDGFLAKIDEWDVTFKANTARQEEMYILLKQIDTKLDFLKLAVDPTAAPDTPITNVIVEHLNGKESGN